MSGEIKEKRDSKNSKKLRRIVRNLFFPLKIDWDSGWDNVDKKSASDYVIRMLRNLNKGSDLFQNYDVFCIDLLQSLVILPLEEQNYKNIDISYSTFLAEWIKIEDQISSPYYNLYILKGIVDSARKVQAAYMNIATRKEAINTFSKDLKNHIDEVSNFCILKKFHYEKMLCSLYVLARNIEGILFDITTSRMKEKSKEYDRLPLQNCQQIYAAIECNIKCPYIYNEDTIICIVDNINHTNKLYNISEDIADEINELNPIFRGPYLYDLIQNSSS